MSLLVSSSENDELEPPSQDTALRIAMVAPPWFELPPQGYGGTEAVAAALVDQLVDLGHEVTLVGSGENGTKAQNFVQVYADPPSGLLGDPLPEVTLAAEAAKVLEAGGFDVVHDHSLAGPLLARSHDMPTVATVHGPSTGANGEYFERLGRSIDVVAISEAQRRLNPRLNWVGTVHNAIDVESFPFAERKDDYVLWLGRFSPHKGADIAIDAARKAGRRVVLAGKLNEPSEYEYFESEISPRLGPYVEYVGEADAKLKRELFAGAYCLAFPIQWEEPFGMVMVEAMACGTPVIAIGRGSVPEVVEHGVSGKIVAPGDDFAAAIDGAAEIRPENCRRWAKEHFDLPVMAAGYERVYRMLAEGSESIRAITAGLGQAAP